MSDDINLVPDDEAPSKPDAVVIIEETKPETADKPEAKVSVRDAADEGVEALTKNLEETQKKLREAQAKVTTESTARTQAEQRAVKAETNVVSEQRRNVEANFTAASADKAKAEGEIEKFLSEAANLQSEGKFLEAEKARLELVKAQKKLDGAEGYLRQYFPEGLDATIERIDVQPTPTARDTTNVDPVTGIKFTPKTFDWVQKHKDNWKDQDFRVECDAANRAAKKKGLDPETDEYFNFIEQRLEREGYLKESTDEIGDDSDPKPVPKVETVKVAPKKSGGASVGGAPSRAVQGTNGVAKKGIKLSGAQRDATAAILESLPDWFPKGTNADQVAAKSIKDAAAAGEQWAIDQLANQ